MKIENALALPCPAQQETAESQSGLEFTIATEEDFADIMSMSKDIYGGLDYLPTRYQSWMQEEYRHVVLARKQGKVIALESVCVIDEGETVLVEGLRVAPSERGKGVAGVLLKFCSQFIKARYPEVKVTRLTRDDKLGPKDFQKYRLITKQAILLVRFRAEDLQPRLLQLLAGGPLDSESGLSPPPVLLEPGEARRLFLSQGVVGGVLPNRTILQDWQPFKPLPSNLDILLKKDVDWMVDSAKQPRVASLCTFPFPVPIGDDCFYLNIDVFGKELVPARRQVLAHLRRHTEALRGHVMCQVFLEPALWEPMADLCKRELEVERVKEYTEQCVVEADLL
ncbi:histidine N-acetyltransferase-like [Huso huso]|uniref:Histidine N-acetyltransferase-like n=1 Tax=Huso huso TaxID=61971 RepID=A0ABR0Y1I1_HUSHU|nr:histidine N-acetyltransferase-like [Acipenser ruthenus]XP_058876461.1 histidine N-acetyltransferase-like [Acipenser ruthenus]